MTRPRINWPDIITEVVAGLLLVALTPLVGRFLMLLILGLVLGFLFLVILDTGTGGTSLNQIANNLADWLQSRGGQ